VTNEPTPGAASDKASGLSDAPQVEHNKAASRRWIEVFNQRDDAICVEPQSAPPDAVNLDGPVVEPGAPLLVTMEWRWR